MKNNTNRALGLLAALAAICVGACSSADPNGTVEASGIIETTDVIISSRVAGTIMKLYVREGDAVRAGDTLAAVDNTDLTLQAAQLEAAVDVARAQYELAFNGSRAEDITVADESVNQARVNLASAREDMERYADLVKTRSVTEKTYADARTRYEVAERQLNIAMASYRKLKQGTRSEDIAAARARQMQAEAQLAAARKKITDAFILAPIDGVVTKRATDVGEFVNVGTNMLTISETNRVKLKIYVPENQLGMVNLGQVADLKIDTYPDKIYHGRVVYISPTAEFTPKNVQTKDDRVKLVFEIQIEVDNTSGELKSGITADARLAGVDSLVRNSDGSLK